MSDCFKIVKNLGIKKQQLNTQAKRMNTFLCSQLSLDTTSCPLDITYSHCNKSS